EPNGYAIMPSTVRLGASEFLSAIRCRDEARAWIDTYRSLDGGVTWTFASAAVRDAGEGNPASMLHLEDGRLALVYGHRAAPYEIRARLSDDGGRNWTEDLVVRGDGGGPDLGYVCSVQRRDGKIVSVYYFHDEPMSDRYVAATIWQPPAQKP